MRSSGRASGKRLLRAPATSGVGASFALLRRIISGVVSEITWVEGVLGGGQRTVLDDSLHLAFGPD